MTDSDEVDPDPEDWMPISKAVAKETPGKIPGRGSIRHQPDDNDSDCEILEVLDPLPYRFTFPLDSTPAEEAVEFPPLKVVGRGTTNPRVAAAGPKKRKGTEGPKPSKKRKTTPKERQVYTG